MRNLLKVVLGLVASGWLLYGQLQAQAAYIPYHELEGWDQLPGGTEFGPLTGGFPDPDGEHLWLLGRCGTNNCAGSDRDPILKFDLEGIWSTASAPACSPSRTGSTWITKGTSGSRRARRTETAAPSPATSTGSDIRSTRSTRRAVS